MKKFFDITLSFPKTIIALFLSISLISMYLIFNYLQVDTSTDSLINKNLKFKIDQENLKKDFKILENNILIKISGNKSEVNKAAKLILEDLKSRNELMFYYSPSMDEVFKKNFFVFLNENQKKELVNKLYENQPFISEISSKPRLQGFNNLLSLILKKEQLTENDVSNLRVIFKNLKVSTLNNEFLDWSNVLNKDDNDIFIIIGLKKEKITNFSFSIFYNFLNDLSEKYPNVSIDYTGGLVIDHEEISSVANGASNAGILSLIFVSIILWIAFRNIKAIFYLTISILIGLIITLGLTTVLVGQLNLISVAFAVLFIGLSVDYGIQIYSRILEDREKSDKKISKNIQKISNTLLIASIPSMVGFISFIPTNYTGLSELGVISFIGLIVGLLTNLFFFSSLLIVFKHNFQINSVNGKTVYSKLLTFVDKRKYLIYFPLVFIFIFNSIYYNKINFDSDALNLKDDNLQSVVLAKQLIEKNPTSDYIISVVLDKKDFDKIDNYEKLLKTKTVKSIFSYKDLVDSYNDDELDYFKFLISSQLDVTFFSEPQELKRFKNLLKKVSKIDDQNLSENSRLILEFFEKNIISENDYKQIQKKYFIKFDELTKVLRNLGETDDDFIQNLPFFYKERYLSNSGKYRIEVFPLKNLSEKENLSKFVEDVQEIFPGATGMPVVQLLAGNVVINSFIFAMIISLLFLTFFIFFIFKRIKFVLVTISCLFIGGLLTIFFMIVLRIDFNFANMISLPLLFSLGVSYPVYFLRRYIELNSVQSVVNSKTPSAIFLSAMTTISSFSTLAVSSHQGTSSMGILLFISLSMTIISSMFFLPLIISTLKISSK